MIQEQQIKLLDTIAICSESIMQKWWHMASHVSSGALPWFGTQRCRQCKIWRMKALKLPQSSVQILSKLDQATLHYIKSEGLSQS